MAVRAVVSIQFCALFYHPFDDKRNDQKARKTFTVFASLRATVRQYVPHATIMARINKLEDVK